MLVSTDLARILSCFAALAAAVVIPLSNISDATLLASRDDALAQDVDPVCLPACQQGSCTSGLCGSSLERRSVSNTVLGISPEDTRNNSLYKRVFNYSPGNMVQYKKKAPTNGEAATYLYAVQQGHEDHYYGEALEVAHETSSAAGSQQVEFGDRPFQILSSGLVGCTVVVVVSDKAVWMAHFWQTYSNGLRQANGAHDSLNNVVFHQRVLDHISGNKVNSPAAPLPPFGDPGFWSKPNNQASYPYAEPIGPKLDKDLYPEDTTRCFIMTPLDPLAVGSLLYPKRMKEMIKRISDVLGYKPTTIGLTYTPWLGDYASHMDYMGKALFQYDPNSNKRGTKAYRIFFERRFVDVTPI